MKEVHLYKPDLRINIVDLCNTDETVIEAARIAVSIVLIGNLEHLDPVDMVFISNFRNNNGIILPNNCGSTSFNGKRITLAMQSSPVTSFQRLVGIELGIFYIAAYEAAHIARKRLGLYKASALSTQEYLDSIEEDAAWEETLHVAKALKPNFSGSFSFIFEDKGIIKTYVYPEASKYSLDSSQIPDFLKR